MQHLQAPGVHDPLNLEKEYGVKFCDARGGGEGLGTEGRGSFGGNCTRP